MSLSGQAIGAARAAATSLYGAQSVPAEPRLYKGKTKNAQEAHEAVRPAGDVFASPSELGSKLRADELKLYDLIWKRTVASQMVDAKGETVTATLEISSLPATADVAFSKAEWSASGTVLSERGFLQAYEESKDEEASEDRASAGSEAILPPLSVGEITAISEIAAKSHSTQPPARYTEASLVKALEERGIGRLSTYASIISVIIDRGYVFRREIHVCDLTGCLIRYF